uniref:VirD4_2 n=1 Tax=Helicobacter pylori TaxID=210 RepID=A0A3G1LXQ1_HELPX|nr:VirD4_2 [Helicobacter pylori]
MREKSKTLKDRFKDKASNLFHKFNSIQKDYYTKMLPKACKDVFTLGSSKSYPMTLNFNKGFLCGAV